MANRLIRLHTGRAARRKVLILVALDLVVNGVLLARCRHCGAPQI